MGKKILVEVCLISARGLRRSSSLWKHQWFAVGWIDPNSKYCTKIDASADANPTWKTKFCTSIDASELKLQDLSLQVEVHCREPIFLRERLHGTAAIALKEFLANIPDGSNHGAKEEVGSFQLRKGKTHKPQGFVDVSIRVSEEREESSSYPDGPGNKEGFELLGDDNGINLDGAAQFYQPQPPIQLRQRETNPGITMPYARPIPPAANYSNKSAGGLSSSTVGGIGYHRAQTPPPPPPSNIGYMPTFMPSTGHFSGASASFPSSRAVPARNIGSSFGMGVGAGALAAGAMIFGDDFMSGFDVPTGLSDVRPVMSTDPPF